MPYMLLVMEPVGQREARPIPDGQVLYDRMLQFGENLKARGIGKFYDSLGSTAKGVRPSSCAHFRIAAMISSFFTIHLA